MTLYAPDIRQAQLGGLPEFADAHRVVRPLVSGAGIFAAAIIVFWAPAGGIGPAAWRPALLLLRQNGTFGVALAVLCLAVGASLSCMLTVRARQRALAPQDRRRAILTRVPWHRVFAGRVPALPVFVTACAALAGLYMLRPESSVLTVPATATWFVLAGASVFAAFPLLIAERVLSAIPLARFPESPRLKPFAIQPIACLVLFAVADVVAGLGLDLTVAVALLLAVGTAAVAVEMLLRAVWAFAMPPRELVQARTPVNSLLLRPLGPALARPASWSALLRERFGIDFGRSWALRYVRNATPPIVAALAAFCIFLTGVTRIDSNERGIYERSGRPVAVLRPGLHLILPGPFGQIRRTELGVVHTVPIRYADAASQPGAAPEVVLAEVAPDTAEGPPPASANRLWDAVQPFDVSYIISSETAGRQNLETISASVRVLYRIGLDDASARHAVYAAVDNDATVRTLAGQVLARYFASRTLPQILGEDRISITHRLQSSLQRMLDDLGAGVDVVAVIVEAIHPPGGAAAAYRIVQAAEIKSNTEISVERGRARTTASLALRDADTALSTAKAAAAERLSAAGIVRTNFRADAVAYHRYPSVFVLERYLAQLSATLPAASVEIVDDRLSSGDGPTLDLRPFDEMRDTVPLRAPGNGENPQ
jgi:regulator of protease activity HflC (stomatin/prohibitin superfamily)